MIGFVAIAFLGYASEVDTLLDWDLKIQQQEIDQVRQKAKSYILPSKHPLRRTLNRIFSSASVLDNEATLAQAGFTLIQTQHASHMTLLKHPDLSGYLIKAYMNSENRLKDDIPGWKWLIARCDGAQNIRKLIKKKNLHFFTVPDKWVYFLPNLNVESFNPIILIVTDMDIVTLQESEYAWKYLISRQHLDELYCLFSHGYGSACLPWNIPYTKQGKFACVDTEYPKRKMKYSNANVYLSDEMKIYWKKLIKSK